MDSPMVVTMAFQKAECWVHCSADCLVETTEPWMAGNLDSMTVASWGSQRAESTVQTTADLTVNYSAGSWGGWTVAQMVAQMVGWMVFHWAAQKDFR